MNFTNLDYTLIARNNIINFKIKNIELSDYINHIKGWHKDNNLKKEALRCLI